MKKIALTYGFLLAFAFTVTAQKYASEKSIVTFFSEAPIENISAVNKKSTGMLDVTSTQVAFSIPNNEFQFEKRLMQEHFNEKYMESEKYPKSTFQGTILNFNPSATGPQKVSAKGKLTIHGVTKDVEIPGTIEMTPDSKVLIKSTFKVMLKDYNITIPQILWQNIAEEIEVTADFTLKPKS
jgi:polyisoprenoid-binding protein YceI